MARVHDTESFIEKARKVHGDKYDYSKAEYTGAKNKVEIICPEHGSFYQTPSDHLSGNGCRICGAKKCKGSKKLTTQEFIEKARKVHGDKYDYSKVEYVNGNTKVCIICPEHGEFWQIPQSHIRGRGCYKCARPSHDTESFIEKARKVHGDKYDYSKVEYVNTKSKVEIICPEHGSFMVSPNWHLDGVGCRKCANKYDGYNGSYSTQDFINEARKKYGDLYDYSKTDLENRLENGKVIVTCKEIAIDGKEYGDYEVNPVVFLNNKFQHKIYTKDLFIRLGKYMHSEEYDYSKVDFENMNNREVTIICPKHGEFRQTVTRHLRGDGCVLCNNKKEALLYKQLKEEYPSLVIEKQKRFEWLGKKSLDFYLPEFSVGIEYQGVQHFKEVERFEVFEIQRKRDIEKKDLCSKHGVKLVYFTFDPSKTEFLGERILHNVNEFNFLKK